MQIRKFAFVVLVTSFGFFGCGQPEEEDLTPTLKLEISAPADSVYTNGSVTIQVVVTEGTPERVVLEKDGEPLMNLEPPYQYTWDTSREPEGMYALRARAIAGDASAESSVRNVVVDRTAPTVVSRLPLTGSSYACGDVPARIEFSEPIQNVNVSDTSFALESGTGALPITVTWSDERTGITIAPVERLVRGTHVSVRIDTALTDLAGNPLIAPEGPWSWESPEYCSTTAEKSVTEGSEGAPWSSELITLDADMNPVLVWTANNPCRTYLRRWEGSAWSASELVSSQCGQAHLRYSEETLFVAQSGPDNGVSLLQKVDGAWSPLGGAINPGSAFGGADPVAAFDASGRAMVAWWERTEPFDLMEGYPLHVRWWSGTEWQDLGGRVGGVFADFAGPSLDVNAGGFPIVAFGTAVESWRRIVVKQWDGWNWSTMGLPIGQGVENPQLVVRDDDVPFVAYEDQNQGGPIMVSFWNGTAWEQLGDGSNLGASGAGAPSMILDHQGRPIVAFTQKDEVAGTTVQVRRWSGSEWVSVGGAFAVRPAARGSRPSITLDANNRPVLSLTEGSSQTGLKLHVWHLNY